MPPRVPPYRAPALRYPPEILSHDEVMALLEACGQGPIADRNRALIGILYRAGLRVSEALALHPKDLDPARGSVRVLRGKGGRSRTVGMDAEAFGLVRTWMDRRAAWSLSSSTPLICTRQGNPLSSSYVRRLMASLGVTAGITKRVHPHGLRHTHASQLRAEGMDIGIISKQLGHRSIATTAHYLDHIAPWAVVEAVGARKW
jgi:site-specific recombinase XerD